MTVIYNTQTLTNRLQQVINAIDGSSAAGFMRLLDLGGNVLSSPRFNRPCGVAAGGLLTFSGPIIDGAIANNGTALFARCEDAAGTVVISGLTVGASSASEVNLGPTNVLVAGQTLAIVSAFIQGN